MKTTLSYLLLAVGLVIGFLFMMVVIFAFYPVGSMISYIGIAIMMLVLQFSDNQ